ncbi:MAG TPA: hypothetical protein VFC63_29220 [Blastocatellia bacterium]|nr:hypothetical protein [Blastocatellia bacterium]
MNGSVKLNTRVRFAFFWIFVLAALSLSSAETVKTSDSTQDKPTAGPSDVIKDFPALKWEMGFKDVVAVITKSGASPATFNNNEIAWDGKFSGTAGRATVRTNESGISQMGVLLYCAEKQDKVFADLQRALSEKYGDIASESDTSLDLSKLWKPGKQIVVELRKVKDPDSPVITLQWVHE